VAKCSLGRALRAHSVKIQSKRMVRPLHASPTRVWGWLISLAVMALPAFCAAGSKAPIAGLPFRHCTAHAPPAVEKALCEADSSSFWEQTKRLVEAQNGDEQRLAVRVLERVWRKDPSLGEGLPWDALSEDDFEAFVVELLAPVVRDGLSDVPLEELQRFATRYRSKPSGKDYAIVLIGLTDAPGQTEFLADIVRKDRAGKRRTAILALGTMCESAATKILNNVVTSESFSEDDKKVASIAVDDRQSSRVRLWCSRTPKKKDASL
jgi:hypothetical protein